MRLPRSFWVASLLCLAPATGCSDDAVRDPDPDPDPEAHPEPGVRWATSLDGWSDTRVFAANDGVVVAGHYRASFGGAAVGGAGLEVAWLDGEGHLLASTQVSDDELNGSSASNRSGRVGVVTFTSPSTELGEEHAACGSRATAPYRLAFTWLDPDGGCSDTLTLDRDLGVPRYAAMLATGEMVVSTYVPSNEAPSGHLVVVGERGLIWEQPFQGNPGPIAVRESDGRIAMACKDLSIGTLRTFEVSGELVGAFGRAGLEVSALAFTADGGVAAAGFGSGPALLGLDDGMRLQWEVALSDDFVEPSAIIALPDGDLLVAIDDAEAERVFGQTSDARRVLWRTDGEGGDPRPAALLEQVSSGVVLASGQLVVTGIFQEAITLGDQTFEGTETGYGPLGSFAAGLFLEE